jgi:Raf kinase inhibitor-like YbhB/YbcL family protein
MFTLTCLSYKDKESISPKHTHHSIKGQNISPGFRWDDPPMSAKSFAFTIIDPHPVAKNWVHWMLVNIPLRIREIAEGASGSNHLPPGSKELDNTYGESGYGGPAPPKGSGAHPYVATIYALNIDSLNVPRESSLRIFQNAIEGKVIAERSMTGYYEVK